MVSVNGMIVPGYGAANAALELYTERLGGAVGRKLGVDTAEEAVAAARRLGFPVAVKLASDTITHKSDVGGVVVECTPEEEAAIRAEREKVEKERKAAEDAARKERDDARNFADEALMISGLADAIARHPGGRDMAVAPALSIVRGL